jgi:hypothetical protein
MMDLLGIGSEVVKPEQRHQNRESRISCNNLVGTSGLDHA